MVNEVSKLIYNALIEYHAVSLPDVGTISVVRHSATMGSKNELMPPHYDIEYTSDKRAKSLVDIISACAGVDNKRAEEIYLRWLDKSREGSVVVIERVGTIRDKSFAVDTELVTALNPCHYQLRITRRKKLSPLYILLVLILVGAVGYGCWWYFGSKAVTLPVDNSESLLVENTLDVDAQKPIIEVVEDIVEAEVVVEEPEIVEEPLSDWRTRDDIRHRVIVGSYSTIENAERAISDINKRLPNVQCDCFKLGNMYAVTVFGSVDKQECQEFKDSHSEEFTQSWIHTPKKFR